MHRHVLVFACLTFGVLSRRKRAVTQAPAELEQQMSDGHPRSPIESLATQLLGESLASGFAAGRMPGKAVLTHDVVRRHAQDLTVDKARRALGRAGLLEMAADDDLEAQIAALQAQLKTMESAPAAPPMPPPMPVEVAPPPVQVAPPPVSAAPAMPEIPPMPELATSPIPSAPAFPSAPEIPSLPDAPFELPALPALPDVSGPAVKAAIDTAGKIEVNGPALIAFFFLVIYPSVYLALRKYVEVVADSIRPYNASALWEESLKTGKNSAMLGISQATPALRAKGRSALEIFFGGLQNLQKDPTGWLNGGFDYEPPPLQVPGFKPPKGIASDPNVVKIAGKPMGAKERAKLLAKNTAQPSIIEEYKKKNLMEGAPKPPPGGFTPPAAAKPPPPAAKPPPPAAKPPPVAAPARPPPVPAAQARPPPPVPAQPAAPVSPAGGVALPPPRPPPPPVAPPKPAAPVAPPAPPKPIVIAKGVPAATPQPPTAGGLGPQTAAKVTAVPVAAAPVAAAQPVVAKAVPATPVAAAPVAAKAVAVAAKPVAATPVAATPVAATPVAATPVAATPVAATPVVATPVAAKPVAATAVAATPVAATPVAAKPVAAKPVAAKAVAKAVPAPPVAPVPPAPPVPVKAVPATPVAATAVPAKPATKSRRKPSIKVGVAASKELPEFGSGGIEAPAAEPGAPTAPGMPGMPSPAAQSEVTDKMTQLQELLDAGLISQEEFADSRQRIMDSI